MSATAAGADKAKKPVARRAGGNTTAAKKTTSSTKAARQQKTLQGMPTVAPVEVSHRIHALLHTIHQIERYEERLCSMQDAIKRTGRLNAPLLRDLKDLLEEIPSREYQHDLDAVRDAVLA